MSISDLPTGETTQSAASQRRVPLATLTAAIFVSAALLFAVQPMFTKMVLPRLGGAPAVWSVAMVFFQAALRAGPGFGRYPPFGDDCRLPRAAAPHRDRLGQAARGRGSVLAAGPVCGL